MAPGSPLSCDEDLLRNLPLPLAQLYRRAHNAKSALERHQAAYYLWEATLKLLASAAVVEYAELPARDPVIAERLQSLARPSLGHWWEIVRRIVPLLAEAGDGGFRAVRDLVLGRMRDDLPRAAGLDFVLREALGGEAPEGGQTAVRLTELFDRLVQYRNRELGHGAAGQRSSEYYDRMGRAVLLGTAEVLARLDVLAGRRLLLVDEVRRDETGRWLIGRCQLQGENARRLEAMELPRSEAAMLPDPGKVYLLAPSGGLRSVHPLLVYDAEPGEAFFLSARRGERRAEFLSYTSGRVLERDGAGDDVAALLGRILGAPVEREAVAEWELKSQAEEPAATGERAASIERRIGGFDLLSRIGRGGMGVVYRAWQQSLGRQVALKCLLRAGDPKAEARFAREIRSLGRVEHPSLVKIFTSGAEGDQWFYAMELIEGADLGSICESLAGTSAPEVSEAEWKRALTTACEEARRREEPLGHPSGPAPHPTDPEAAPSSAPASRSRRQGLLVGEGHIAEAVELVRQAAGAAHALHEAGVIHRDIKPGNIMVTREGSHAVLMDLGLAQLVDDAQGRLTRTRQFVGTLRYASPEQVLAAGALDRRSDVYSLGATLWELLALRPLFGASDATPTPDLMLKIQTEDPESPRRANSRVPHDLEAIVMKCLEKERARRYATAGDLAEDLARWQAGEAVTAQPPSLRYLLGKYVRRHKGRFTAAVALVLLALATNFGAFWRVNEARKEAMRLQKATETALFDTYTSRGVSAGDAGNPAQSVLWFASAARLAGDDAHRQEANRIRVRNWSRLVPRPLRAFPHEGPLAAIAFDATGRYLLTRSASHRSLVWDVEEESKVDLAALDKPVRHAAWGPKGDLLALATPEGAVQLLAFPGGDLRWQSEGAGAAVLDLAFSPDGRYLAWGSDAVHALDLRSSELSQRSWPHPGPVSAVSFSPQGDRIATSCDDGKTRVFELARAGSEPAIPPLVGVPAEGLVIMDFGPIKIRPEFVDGGRSVLTLHDESTLALWNLMSGMRERLLSHADQVGSVVQSPDGRLVLVRGIFGLELWHAGVETSSGLLGRSGHLGSYHAVFSPDGAFLASADADSSVRLWRVGLDMTHLLHQSEWASLVARIAHPHGVGPIAFSPDSRFLAAAHGDGLVRLFDIPHDNVWDHALPLDIVFSSLSMTPDGRHVVRGASGSSWNAVKGIRVYETATGRPVGPRLDVGGIAMASVLSPDGVHLLTLASMAPSAAARQAQGFRPDATPGRIRIWDFRRGVLLHEVPRTTAEPWRAVFHPAGEVAAVLCANGDVWILDATRGSLVEKRDHGGLLPPWFWGYDLLFSPDGKSLISVGLGNQVKVWDASGWRERYSPLEHPGAVLWCTLSADGRLLAVATDKDEIHVWDVEMGRAAAAPLTHRGRVLEFSPEGDRLLASGGDGLARVWSWRAGTLAGPPLETSLPCWAGWIPRSRWIATQTHGNDPGGGHLRFWDESSGVPVTPLLPFPGFALVCDPAGRWGVQTGGPCTGIVRLADYTTPELEVGGNDFLEWAEVLSGQRLHDGGGLLNLTSAEWLERWRRLRLRDPRRTHLGRSTAEALAWHRERGRKLADNLNWDAGAWHLRRVQELGGEVPPGDLARLEHVVRSWHFAPETESWRNVQSFVAMDTAKLHAIEASALARPLVRSENPFVDFGKVYPRKTTFVAGWAARRIVCDRPREVRVFAGHDDVLRVWVNGAVVIEDLTFSPPVPDMSAGTATLKAGENTLTAEVSNGFGHWRLYLRLEDLDGTDLALRDDGTLVRLEGLEE